MEQFWEVWKVWKFGKCRGGGERFLRIGLESWAEIWYNMHHSLAEKDS